MQACEFFIIIYNNKKISKHPLGKKNLILRIGPGLRRDISLKVRHVTCNHQYISSNLVYPIKKRGGFGEEVFT